MTQNELGEACARVGPRTLNDEALRLSETFPDSVLVLKAHFALMSRKL